MIAELIEWACRTYAWPLQDVIDGIPAVQIALLYRCNRQGIGGVRTATLGELEEIERNMEWLDKNG